jgi:hypothetical protein
LAAPPPPLVLGAILVAGFSALRLALCFDDLWLNEIWALVAKLDSPVKLYLV